MISKEQPHQVVDLSAQLEAYDQYATSCYKSLKAMVEGRIVQSILPSSLVLFREIMPAFDNEAIFHALHKGVELGYHVGVRTCYKPQPPNSPWVMGVKTPADIDFVMSDKLVEWQRNKNLTEIIIMHNPPLLGLKEERVNHGVMRMEYQYNRIYFETRLYTDQLRGIEGDTLNKELIRGAIALSPRGMEKVSLDFGSNYTTTNEPVKLETDNGNFWAEGVGRLNGSVEANAGAIVYGLVKHIQLLCYNPSILLRYRLEALANHGLEFSEWQMRLNPDGIGWLKLYGLRGSRDDTHWM